FDAQQLVVFGEPVRARAGAGLDLPAIRRHGQVGNGRVFGLAGAVRHHGAIGRAMGGFDRVKCLAQRADLVDRDQNRVGDAFLDPSFKARGVVTKRSSPTSWTRAPSDLVSALQPDQSSSAIPSSIDTIG